MGFSTDDVHVFSGGNDKTVMYWDVPTGDAIATFSGHTVWRDLYFYSCLHIVKDNVKTGMMNPSGENLIITGGYDHQIMVWDVRSGSVVCRMNQGVPVESLVVLPEGGTVIASGKRGDY